MTRLFFVIRLISQETPSPANNLGIRGIPSYRCLLIGWKSNPRFLQQILHFFSSTLHCFDALLHEELWSNFRFCEFTKLHWIAKNLQQKLDSQIWLSYIAFYDIYYWLFCGSKHLSLLSFCSSCFCSYPPFSWSFFYWSGISYVLLGQIFKLMVSYNLKETSQSSN